MRGSLVAVIVAAGLVGAGVTAAEPDAKPPAAAVASSTPASDATATHVHELLAAISSAPSAAAREAAAKELTAIGAPAVPTLATFLARDRASSSDARHDVLKSIHASVPDKTGRFSTPSRQEAKEVKADDALDWFASLVKLPLDTAGLGDVLADVAALRALAASKDMAGAKAIFDVSFAPSTMMYRDECGRLLRAMQPYSIPELIRAAQSQHGDGDRARYANYQLERIDRQDPDKALASAATDEILLVAILDAFRETHHREAVHAVLTMIDNDAPRVRAAAREAWMAYVTGPPPPPAPKKKLVIPGGKTADKETALWLTYRELADQELRTQSEDLFGETIGEHEKYDLEALSKRIFAFHDGERKKREDVEFAAGKTKADAGDAAGAAQVFDRLLAANPERPERAQMAKTYLALAEKLEQAQTWPDAAAAFSKAQGLDPSGPSANHALARYHFALGRVLQAQNKDGSAEFRAAAVLEPTFTEAKKAAVEPPKKMPWLLFGGIGAGGLAILLFIGGVMRKQRDAA